MINFTVWRGTSTFDGLSLAWASAHPLADKIQAFTRFATHYFELTGLTDTHESIENVHLDATEYGDDIVFMHTVKPGPANQSYGIQVAKLAGIPKPAINFARKKLLELEKNALGLERDNPKKINLSNENNDLKESSAAKKAISQADLFLSDNSALNEALSALNPDQMSPMAALEALYQLKKLL